MSRRQLLGAAGGAVAGGVALAGGGAAAVAAPAAAAGPAPVGTGPQGSTTVEFRGRIRQTGSNGQVFSCLAYLIRAAGAGTSDLFASGKPSEGTALFTAVATGNLVSRVLDMNVHALDVAGQLDVYQRSSPGASFADPASFKVGRHVASFTLTLQDVLAVFASDKGIPTLTGDMRQTQAGALAAGLSGRSFGRVGLRLRLFATGLGTLIDPVTLNAVLEIAGNWSAE
jgi:hypothetical protein